jgi:hypothetical protein
MRIINPSFGQALASAEKVKAGSVDWRRDPIILFSNSKPNAKELLEGLRDKLGSIRPTEGIDFVYKESASRPAANGVVDEVSRRYRAALLALGD